MPPEDRLANSAPIIAAKSPITEPCHHARAIAPMVVTENQIPHASIQENGAGRRVSEKSVDGPLTICSPISSLANALHQ